MSVLSHIHGISTVALWNSLTLGGGLGLTAMNEYKVCTDTTKVGMPETGIGFFVDVGMMFHLRRLRNSIGRYMALTGSLLEGKDVYNAGLANV